VVSPLLESLDYFKKYDFYTYRHILIVLALTALMCQDLVVDYQELMEEIAAGAMHDIGKICVPMQILKKSSPLTQTERAILEHHTAAGFVLLCYYHQYSQHLAAITARDHHERKDGSGYPLGIQLNDPWWKSLQSAMFMTLSFHHDLNDKLRTTIGLRWRR
jgi:HD-GYP domain-containing protein (c-di-GMP phosphodiesterase class II)